MKTLCNDQVGIKESVAELITTGLRRRDGITLAAWQEASSTFIILECICICILDILYIRYIRQVGLGLWAITSRHVEKC